MSVGRCMYSRRVLVGLKGPNYALRAFTTQKSGTAISDECISIDDAREFLIWKCKIVTGIVGTVISLYGSYLFISSDYDVRRARRRFSMHVNGLIYGNDLLPRQYALINSQYNVALECELKRELAKYFINLDNLKENGVRRSDVLALLEALGIPLDNHVIEKFINRGDGDLKELRKISGCSIQEFGELLEYLVIEQRINSNDAFESNLLSKIKEINSKLDNMHVETRPTFRLGNPYIAGAAKEIAQELLKYNVPDHSEEILQVTNELDRNTRFKEKLETKAKLTNIEQRRLNFINDEIDRLQKELGRLHHKNNLLHYK
ncbi:hypothetical protein BdWA1_002756 [Babesia duncani]|uniref:Uncharacterized protein n=1 Tax=Babesia duncani TaxID=323732 RepID=A0AAD9PJU1_9APIC|nr:hypothetical protein BdWA1_002756 [Babesia duncani]